MRPMPFLEKWIFLLLGIPLIGTYFYAFALGDLRRNTISFEYAFFGAFLLYAIACLWVLGTGDENPRRLFWIFALAAVTQAILTLTRPTLSDDMYRYVWDGRVQAQGISPYRYPPNAQQLSHLRDGEIYPFINRKNAVTVYPPGAEAAYALLWQMAPDSARWLQIVMALAGVAAGILLMRLLQELGRSPARALIYLWSPLLAYETAHAAHLDGLVLPLLVGTWWARVRERDGLVGILLGIATALKLYPALLLPFLWRPDHPKGRWQMPLAFLATLTVFYLPYTITSGGDVLGFLPLYLKESFNVSPLVSEMKNLLHVLGWRSWGNLTIIALGTIAIFAGWSILNPARDAETAIRRCILPIGILTLLSQNLFSWYMLWLLPLIAIFLTPTNKRAGIFAFPRLDAWTGWWLFCGLIALSYTFFIEWKPVPAAIYAQFLPLYAILLIDFLRTLLFKFNSLKPRAPTAETLPEA